jgi:hypothetical protein
MVSADETPVGGSGLSNGKAERQGKKKSEKQSEKRSRKPRPKVEAKPEQIVELPEEISAILAGVESSATETTPIETVPVEIAPVESSPVETSQLETSQVGTPQVGTPQVETPQVETAPIDLDPAETAPIDPVPSAQAAPAPAPVNLQTIGNVVGDYTLKTFEQTSSFFEQLAGARSFNRAFELQSQYARQAFETFVAESENIHELHREMTRQRWQRLEGLVAGTKTRSR